MLLHYAINNVILALYMLLSPMVETLFKTMLKHRVSGLTTIYVGA